MASKAAAHFLQFRIQYSSIAFLYYDYALTFPAEVKYIWGRKIRLSSLLYICCRYALVANVFYALAQMKKLGSRYVFFKCIARLYVTKMNSCDGWYIFDGVISVLGRAAVIVALTSRTYAVYSCNRYVLALLACIGLTCIILDIMHVPGLRCVGSTSNQTAATLLSILMCVFESTAAVLTIVRSLLEFRIGGSWKLERGSFFTVIFKQGLLYFCIVSIFTIAAAILNFRAPAGSFFQRLPNAYTLPLSCTLIARFLLQLREYQEKEVVFAGQDGQTADQHPQTLTSLRTVAVLDSVIMSDFGDGKFQIASGLGSEVGKQETESESEWMNHTHVGDIHSIRANSEKTWASGPSKDLPTKGKEVEIIEKDG